MKIVRIISVVMMVAMLQGCFLCSYSYSYLAFECFRDNTIYLRDFSVKLKSARKNKPAYVKKFSLVLNKGTHYRFILCNNLIGYQDRVIFELRSDSTLFATTHQNGIDNYTIDFICPKTAVYYVCIFSKEEWKHERNRAIVVLSFVPKY